MCRAPADLCAATWLNYIMFMLLHEQSKLPARLFLLRQVKLSAAWGRGGVWRVSVFLPSSAFFSHSTNFFICSRKTLFPLLRWASLYHFNMASSFNTSAVGRERTWSVHVREVRYVQQTPKVTERGTPCLT